MRTIVILSLFQLGILVLYGMSVYLAFHPALRENESADQGMKSILGWLNEHGGWWVAVKKIATIAIVMTIALFVISRLPARTPEIRHYSISPLKIFMIYNTVVTAAILSGYIGTALRLTSEISKACLVAILFGLANAWVYCPNWLTIDIAAALLGVMVLVQFRSISFRATILLSLAIMTYDATAVFGTHAMQKAAAGFIALPMLFTIPSSLSLHAERLLGLGLGDVILPGTIIMMAMRNGLTHRNWVLGSGAMMGYVAGAIITVLMLEIFHFPQPATIYLMPCAQIGFIGAAWRYGLLKKIS